MTKQHICLGILAHVDAGKTTLSEALLYTAGVQRTLGRVDHGNAFLDTHALERERGITIFSKQALFSAGELSVTLVDTPGHGDFAAEAERVLPVLDCAVLVISATDGIQAHTVTLWQLLRRYRVPTFLFINKTDLPGKTREALLTQLQTQLDAGCADCESLEEAAAMCDEALLEEFLTRGTLDPAAVRAQIAARRLFPCCFGSGLKLTGVREFLELLALYAPRPQYPADFRGKVYKISRDPQGNRLSWLKVTGGSLKVRSPLTYTTPGGEALTEKAVQLRLYSGEKFTAAEEVFPGQLCAVAGLSATWAGMTLGSEPAGAAPLLEPVMTYRLVLPQLCDPFQTLQKLRQLEEEDPQLHLMWDEASGQIHLQVMGKVQQEVLCRVIAQRFGLEVSLADGRIFYKETIAAPVVGVGHFEPLRHYAEVHILLEPLPRGSGLQFDSVCSTDVLDGAFQRLIHGHMTEKTHLGVLTGGPITDMKLTLLTGRAHVKHTEGGDFRQATYRAIRQGLMQAQSVLLEPWYAFTLRLPTEQIGRAITDIRAMSGEFDAPEAQGTDSVLTGLVPASELCDYADQVAAYTQGRGHLQVKLHGYRPCHNAQQVIVETGYDPEADLENSPDSVFCDHGAGVHIKWNKVPEYMHLDSGYRPGQPPKPEVLTRHLQLEDKALEAIMEREFGTPKTVLPRAQTNRPATEKLVIRPPRQTALIVDGYNIIFAWEELAALAKEDLDAARRRLCDLLSSYAGFKKTRLVVVFDGYKVKGNPGTKETFHNIQVVYTKENETGDAYIEALVAQIGTNYAVRVATSDSLVQLSSLRSGVLRMSARELQEELAQTRKQMQAHFHN